MAKRQMQDQVAYRRGNPINHCGVCANYQGRHYCSQVMGNISPYGLCDSYRADKNPFGSTLSPNEVAAIKNMALDRADRSNG
jgi:hypothetical protein